MRNAILSCLCFAAAVAVSAFEGQVIGPNGKTLAGARVSELGRSGSVVTDAEGRFRLEPDPRPPFYLVVTRPDGVAFRPTYVEALPPKGETLVVHLETLAENVTVVSGGVPDLHLPPAAAGTVMGKQDLARRLPVNLPQALENIPGSVASETGYSGVPGLRGLPLHRTLILVDEGRVTAERRAGPSATYLNPETLDELEVVRGPGSVAYGSDAFGGVIRARSRMPNPGQPLQLRYAIFGAHGLAGGGAAVEASGSLGAGGVLAAAHFRDFGDFSSPKGDVRYSGAQHKGFRLAYQVPVAGGMLGVGWRTDLGRDIDKPEPQFTVRRSYYPEENSHRAHVKFEHPGWGGWSRWAASVAWDSYQLILDRDVFATATAPRTVSRANVKANDYSLRLEGERPLSKWGRLVVGLDVAGRFNLRAVNSTSRFAAGESSPPTFSQEISIEDARRDNLAIFSGMSSRLGPVEIALGLRGDHVKSENSAGYFGNRSITNSKGSGFVAATVPLGRDASLTAQASRGFRSPLLSDRFYRGISGRGFITGNPDLKPEVSTQYDLALRWGMQPFFLALYGFQYRIDDLIERYRAGQDFFFRNRGEAEIRGAELEVSAALAEGHELALGLQSLRGEVRGAGTPIDGIPPRGGFVVYRHEPSTGLGWMARFGAWARDERPGPLERVVGGYAVLDAAVGYRFSPAMEIQILGRNLLDRAYLGSADADAVLAPGRTLQLALRGRL